MNSPINTGKHSTYNLNAKQDNNLQTSPLTSKNSPLPQLPSVHSLHSLQSLRDILDQYSPSEPSRINNDAYAENWSPLVDRIKPSSPKEPSLIHKSPANSLKHSYEPSTQTPSLPMKRVKLEDQDSISQAFDLTTSDNIDFNTVNGSNLVDFWFSHRTPSQVVELEEAERLERTKTGANPILLGKLYNIQKEFMKMRKPSVNLSEESNDAKSYGKYQTSYGEKIQFTWPRVPSYIKDMEEQARNERIEAPINLYLFTRVKSVNSEIRNKVELHGISFLRNMALEKAESILNQVSKTFNFAKDYTSGLLKFGQLNINQEQKSLEWFRLQEEMERARRINQEEPNSKLELNKKRFERELLQKSAETL